MNPNPFLEEYYNSYNEDERLLSKHGQIEFLTTIKYIKSFLRPGMRILEIGAGTGRYAHTLARMGYQVDAVELIGHNIDVFHENTEPGEAITIVQGNALDLSTFSGETYDITLLLGPMYHLYEEVEQRQALSEALRVTKKNGVLFTAYCISDASILGYGFQDGNITTLIEKGMVTTDTFKAYSKPSDLFQLYRKEDIDALMADTETERIHYVATDLVMQFIRDTIDEMSDPVYQIYLNYHFAICERPDMVGMTNHSLDIVRRL